LFRYPSLIFCARGKLVFGAIAGDVIGSVFEGSGLKTTEFRLLSSANFYTDDTVLTAAVAAAILDQGDYADFLRKFGRRHPGRGYGGNFHQWLSDESIGPYNSWGNGSAMRVSPVGWAFDSVEEVLIEAKRSADVTHNHPEGVRGAQAVALSVYFARCGAEKFEIRQEITARFGYDLTRTADEVRSGYSFDVSCQGSVPESIICFLDSDSFESAVRLAISLGGDADTMACIAGGVAEAYYRALPESVELSVRKLLTSDLLEVIDRFRDKYCSTSKKLARL
jgi:ADP-ribosylglycohydrolase